MKQIGMILFVLVMVIVVSCSKAEDEVLDMAHEGIMEGVSTYNGTFEGEWQLSKYAKTCSGEIEVKANEIVFDLPADYLVPKLGLVNEKSKADHSDEPFFMTTSGYTYFNTTQTMHYSMLGYSTDAIYIKNNQGDGGLSFGVKADDVNYRLSLVGFKEQPSAVFDFSSGQWRLAIPIDKATIYNRKTDVQISIALLNEDTPETSAWLLVFRTKKKIK